MDNVNIIPANIDPLRGHRTPFDCRRRELWFPKYE
jgi:hypothetical protein